MAAAVRSEEQFLCSICLEVFSEPVSTPCGHNFCKGCITESWDSTEVCLCPLCKRSYDTRPELHINTFIKEIVSEFRRQQKDQSMDDLTHVTEVPCDYCTDPKLKAQKSCLVCVSSYCESHLQPHLTVPRLKSHQLIEPEDNLEDRMCAQHQKPLELFCRSEGSYLCTMCALLEHKSHEFVSLKEECDGKRSFLQQTQAEKTSAILRPLCQCWR
uniref:E3 ubiquitin/ISG15 ligase TRIM25-like n=1 Tax=Neogobius melanostomus TaxID=47308 RepID=A0A8C6S5I9_9GOBI